MHVRQPTDTWSSSSAALHAEGVPERPKSLALCSPLPRDAAAFLLPAEQPGELWERPEEKRLGWRVFEQLTAD